jgi:trimeric autotransporter adhesin
MVPFGLLTLAPALLAGCYFPVGLDDCHPLQHGSFGRPPRAVHNSSDLLAGPARRASILLPGGLLGFSGAAIAELVRGERITGRSIIAAHCVRPPDRAIADECATGLAIPSDVRAFRLLGSSAAAAAEELHVERVLGRSVVTTRRLHAVGLDDARELARDLAGAAAVFSSELHLHGPLVAAAELPLGCGRAAGTCIDSSDEEPCLRTSRAGHLEPSPTMVAQGVNASRRFNGLVSVVATTAYAAVGSVPTSLSLPFAGAADAECIVGTRDASTAHCADAASSATGIENSALESSALAGSASEGSALDSLVGCVLDRLVLGCLVSQGSALNGPAIGGLVLDGRSLDYLVSDRSVFGSLEPNHPTTDCDSMFDDGVTNGACRAGIAIASGVTGETASTASVAANRAATNFVAADAEDAGGDVAVKTAGVVATSGSAISLSAATEYASGVSATIAIAAATAPDTSTAAASHAIVMTGRVSDAVISSRTDTVPTGASAAADVRAANDAVTTGDGRAGAAMPPDICSSCASLEPPIGMGATANIDAAGSRDAGEAIGAGNATVECTAISACTAVAAAVASSASAAVVSATPVGRAAIRACTAIAAAVASSASDAAVVSAAPVERAAINACTALASTVASSERDAAVAGTAGGPTLLASTAAIERAASAVCTALVATVAASASGTAVMADSASDAAVICTASDLTWDASDAAVTRTAVNERIAFAVVGTPAAVTRTAVNECTAFAVVGTAGDPVLAAVERAAIDTCTEFAAGAAAVMADSASGAAVICTASDPALGASAAAVTCTVINECTAFADIAGSASDAAVTDGSPALLASAAAIERAATVVCTTPVATMAASASSTAVVGTSSDPVLDASVAAVERAAVDTCTEFDAGAAAVMADSASDAAVICTAGDPALDASAAAVARAAVNARTAFSVAAFDATGSASDTAAAASHVAVPVGDAVDSALLGCPAPLSSVLAHSKDGVSTAVHDRTVVSAAQLTLSVRSGGGDLLLYDISDFAAVVPSEGSDTASVVAAVAEQSCAAAAERTALSAEGASDVMAKQANAETGAAAVGCHSNQAIDSAAHNARQCS